MHPCCRGLRTHVLWGYAPVLSGLMRPYCADAPHYTGQLRTLLRRTVELCFDIVSNSASTHRRIMLRDSLELPITNYPLTITLNLLRSPARILFIHRPVLYGFCVLEGGLYCRRSGKIRMVALGNARFFGVKIAGSAALR